MSSSFASVLTILIGMYGLRLGYAGQLVYYIHPRYVGITVAACVVLVVTGIVAFAILPPSKRPPHRRMARRWLGMSPVILFVAIGILLPARALSSASVEQRSTSVVASQSSSEEDVPDGVGDVSTLDTSEWTFDDFWYSVTIQDRALEHYEGKKVTMVGFVSHPKSAPQGTFHLTRYLMMCCAIDAQTVGFWVQEDNAPGMVDLQDDTWITVGGTFTVREWNNKKTLVIVPEMIEPTEQPEDPYVY